jgi:hypothetical protein
MLLFIKLTPIVLSIIFLISLLFRIPQTSDALVLLSLAFLSGISLITQIISEKLELNKTKEEIDKKVSELSSQVGKYEVFKARSTQEPFRF